MASEDTTGSRRRTADRPQRGVDQEADRARPSGAATSPIDELNEALPQDQMSSEQIEDVMSAISEMGVNIVETDEDAQEEDGEDEEAEAAGRGRGRPLDDGGPRPAEEKKKETAERTDDPVRMYLREMGAVELLSREGEIAIAKRIEAGRDTMIMGPVRKPDHLPRDHHVVRSAQRRRDAAARDPRSRRDAVEGPARREDGGGERGSGDDGEISEETAGPSYKEDEEAEEEEEEADEDEEDEDGERRARRRRRGRGRGQHPQPRADGSGAQARGARELRRASPSLFKKFEKLQFERVDTLGAGRRFPQGQGEEVRGACASNSPPRSRACSSTRPRSNTWSTTSTPSTAG